MVNGNNYEEYMMMYADGELTAAEEQALMAFLYDHPELQSELTAYNMTKLTPDESLTYENKKSLIKPETGGILIAFTGLRKYAIAAGVAALFFASFWTTLNKNTEEIVKGTEVAAIDNKTKAQQKTTHGTTAPTNDKGTYEQVAQATPVTTGNRENYIADAGHNSSPSTNVKHNNKAAATVTQSIELEKVELAALAINKANEVNTPVAIAQSVPQIIAVPTNEPILTSEEEHKSFIDRLPINEEKKGGLETVATALAEKIDKIGNIKDEISTSSISFRIEKKKLRISF